MADTPLPPDASLPTTPEARAAYIAAAQEKRDFQALIPLFHAELLASPQVAAVLTEYDSRSHESLLNSYALHKAVLYTYGPHALKVQEHRFLKIRHDAAEHLWEIQQQKLFVLQCRWRAGEITLPGIRHTHDFKLWSEYIDYCPWLPPITAEDIRLYQAYLRSGTFAPEYGTRWQDYDRFKETPEATDSADDDDDDDDDDEANLRAFLREVDGDDEDSNRRDLYQLPAWYVFHQQHTAGPDPLALPDERGQREEYYKYLWRTEYNEEHARKLAEGPPEHRRPWAPYCHGSKAMGFYLDRFEPAADLPRLHRWRVAQAQEDARKKGRLQEADYWYSSVLWFADETWPIDAHPDWRVALHQAGMSYWCHQMAAVLVEVWHEQEQHRALGLPVVPPIGTTKRKPFAEVNWADDELEHAKAILRGRELAGEPRDFNF